MVNASVRDPICMTLNEEYRPIQQSVQKLNPTQGMYQVDI